MVLLLSCDDWDLCVAVLLARRLYKREATGAWRVPDNMKFQ